mgnify:CR=1 FL=1
MICVDGAEGSKDTLELVLLDEEVDVYIHAKQDRVLALTPEEVRAALHNTRIWVNGNAYVLVVGEPDERTEQLASGLN